MRAMATPHPLEASMLSYYRARAPHFRYSHLSDDEARQLEAYAEYYGDKLGGRRVLEVACGPGFWTEKLALRANHVLAVDAAPEMLEIARQRHYECANVTLVQDDAYTLEHVPCRFSGGFHFQWISHVPRSRYGDFLSAFHSKLEPGAVVVFGDNKDRGTDPDAEGNTYQDRVLPDGSKHRVIKNWPEPAEWRVLLEPVVRSLEFHEFEKDWFVCYALRRP
jgi:demethylmenaquinone methyltransferase/2-methoxy-6-polyprenyl-1,4-benzoquinol methylase